MSDASTQEHIGKYELLTRLATGGMAEVFLASEHGIAGLERLVVIKRILPHLAERPDFVEMFLREGRIIARLNHPNIVQIYELGNDAGRYFLALEYIHGVTLRELQILVNREGRNFPLDAALGAMMQVCQGLHTAHELQDLDGQPLGLVHRDVTPHNIMCTSDGLMKLLDFGIAKATEGELEATFSGDLKGKFSYMSPEQVLQTPMDRRSDIFSLGILLWETLTGRRLFKRKSQLEMMQAISSGEVPGARTFRKDIPPALDALVMRALSIDREQRVESALGFATELEEIARANNLDVRASNLARFVSSTASARLAEMQEALDIARQFSDLSEQAPISLLHQTSSASIVTQHGSEEEEDLPTVVERPAAATPAEEPGAFGAKPFTPEPAAQPEPGEPAGAPEAQDVSGKAPYSRRRRALIMASMLLGMVVIMGLFIGFVLPPVRSGPVTGLGWAPTVEPKVLRREISPLHHYLSNELDRNVTLVISEDYKDLADQLITGKIDYAVLPPLLYVQAKERDPNIVPLALKQFDGANMSDGLLLVPHTVKADTLEDLQGKRFCLTDANSTTGHFLPRAYLRRMGHDPETFIGEVIWSGDHLQVMRDLIAGKCDVGATYSGAYLSADQLGLPISQLRTLAITGHVPQDVVCAGATVPDAESKALTRALLAFDPLTHASQKRLGETQRITGFAEVQDSAWDELREAITQDEKKAP